MKFNFEALPIITKKEKKLYIFYTVSFICFTSSIFVLGFYNIELSSFVCFIYILTSFIIYVLFVIYKRKLKPKLSDFSININNDRIEVIDNEDIVLINKSEIYEIIIHFRYMKGEWINRLRRLSYPSDGKDNTIKIISATTTIEKRIFIPEDMFYHRFYLLGIRLKEMDFPVKMKGFYNY